MRAAARLLVRPAALLCAVLAVLLAAAPAEARWLRAESPRFIVYADTDEASLREQVQRLEGFDRLLRVLHGLPLDAEPPRKLPIYLVRDQAELRRVHLEAPQTLTGLYVAATEEIFGLALRVGRRDDVLWHEYTHHFMLQHFAHAPPTWVAEGYAEYFRTADIGPRRITWGRADRDREIWLTERAWLLLRDVVARPRWAFTEPDDQQRYYAQAWLTHWFMSDSARRARLGAYLEEVGQGADPGAALERAAGRPLRALERILRRYVRDGLRRGELAADPFAPTPVEITVLPPSADDLLLSNQRLKLGAPEDQRAATVEAVRQAAARHPDDSFALLVLGHAELHMGDPATGMALLERLLARDPDHVEALQLLAACRADAARQVAGAERLALVEESDRLLRRALEIDPTHYLTYVLLALNRSARPDYPTEADLALWLRARDLAPQLAVIRLGAARAFLRAGRPVEAAGLLAPLAHAPHGGPAADVASDLLAEARAR